MWCVCVCSQGHTRCHALLMLEHQTIRTLDTLELEPECARRTTVNVSGSLSLTTCTSAASKWPCGPEFRRRRRKFCHGCLQRGRHHTVVMERDEDLCRQATPQPGNKSCVRSSVLSHVSRLAGHAQGEPPLRRSLDWLHPGTISKCASIT